MKLFLTYLLCLISAYAQAYTCVSQGRVIRGNHASVKYIHPIRNLMWQDDFSTNTLAAIDQAAADMCARIDALYPPEELFPGRYVREPFQIQQGLRDLFLFRVHVCEKQGMTQDEAWEDLVTAWRDLEYRSPNEVHDGEIVRLVEHLNEGKIFATGVLEASTRCIGGKNPNAEWMSYRKAVSPAGEMIVTCVTEGLEKVSVAEVLENLGDNTFDHPEVFAVLAAKYDSVATARIEAEKVIGKSGVDDAFKQANMEEGYAAELLLIKLGKTNVIPEIRSEKNKVSPGEIQ